MDLALYFKSVLEQDTAPVVICNLEHTVVYMNSAARLRYRIDIIGKSIKACHNEESNKKIDRVVDWFKKSKANNRVYTSRN
ncbi:MAG: fatty acid/phospholipid synthesis protein PlsX, partial [Ruminococcaceae bacterium]|nr:fatty acid/phospholipid synthesis protein PlsX [Oscillospiraceae bacterium]